jgi:hypothetical protein
MTSFTKALYRRDPKAAEAFYRNQQFEQKGFQGRPGPALTYGRQTQLSQFDAAQRQCHQAPFGRRVALDSATACDTLCGHPACTHGCTKQGGKL